MQTIQARVTRLLGAQIMVRVRRSAVNEAMPCPCAYARVGSVLELKRLRPTPSRVGQPNLVFVRMIGPNWIRE